MHQLLRNRVAIWVGALAATALVAAVAAGVTLASRKAATTFITNGGAQQWIAFEPGGFALNSSVTMYQTIQIANASNATNSYKVTFEPGNLTVGSGLLGPGEARFVPVNLTKQTLGNGYFQVIATYPVLMGGWDQAAAGRYTEASQGGQPTYSYDTTGGDFTIVPLIWQQGCPPSSGSGCPIGTTSGGTGTTKAGG